MKEIRILLVDDEAVARRGLRMRLELEPDIRVVGEAENGLAGLEMARRLTPHVVVMDVEMPVMNGIDAARHLYRAPAGGAVVILSMHDDRATVERALAAGAVRFVAKHRIETELLDAIRAAADGGKGGG